MTAQDDTASIHDIAPASEENSVSEKGGVPRPGGEPPPVFDRGFKDKLRDLLLWRRDVRRFKTDPVEPAIIDTLIDLACLAPSVGYSQPWRFVKVESKERRAAVRRDFEAANAQALGDYENERAKLYAGLKLAGLRDAPVHLAVFVDSGTETGAGLGQRTMPEMLRYSVVTAIHTIWIAARAWGVGVGWVSIVHPDRVAEILDVPPAWQLVAYLCIGYPQEETTVPALRRAGWESKDKRSEVVHVR